MGATRRQKHRYRAFVRAARAWKAGYPHEARVIIDDAGLGKYWPQFMAELLRQARAGYNTAIERYIV